MLNKQGFYISIICWFAFALASTGFDFYSHSVSYYFYDEMLNPSDVIYGVIVQPRYLLLSLIYESISRAGVPLGFVVSFLILLPSYNILKIVDQQSRRNKYNLFQIALIVFIFYLCIFYSAACLVLLWLLAFILTKNRFFLFGVLFHPLGLISGFVLWLFISFKDKVYLFTIILIFYLLLFIFTEFQLFTSVGFYEIRYLLDSNMDTFGLLSRVVLSKRNEIIQAVLIGIIIFLSFRFNPANTLNKIFRIASKIYVEKIFVNIFLCLLYLLLFLYMFEKTTFINSLLEFNFNNVIYASWFDFGDKDLKMRYLELNAERY